MPRTPGSGRKVGTPNKVTVEIKEAARAQGPAAIKLLAKIMNAPKKPESGSNGGGAWLPRPRLRPPQRSRWGPSPTSR